ncbi:MAG: DUF6220 domain-containing protein [Chloroflexota bacterium]
MTQAARYAFVGLAWLFLVGIVVQVFFIGLALFAGSENLESHVTLGWILHMIPIVILIAAALARPGRRTVLLAAALAVTVFIVPILATLRDSSDVIAALHPVGALLAFYLAVLVAVASLAPLRSAGPMLDPTLDPAR